jgi:nucleoid-associated protein YgaU
MKNMTTILLAGLILCVFTFGAIAQQYSYDYKNMKMDEYQAELAKWQQREADAKARLAQLEADIATLNEGIAAAQKEHADCWQQIYAMLDTDEAGYNDFVQQCKALENDLTGFVALSPEDIYSRRAELDEYKKRLADLRTDKRSLGPDPFRILNHCESLINQAEEKGKPTAAGKYEVAKGDYLWKISGMSNIYGDPYAWIRIYTYNRSQISNPDLIYPKQVFDIPRIAGPGQYWVKKGEDLTMIAKNQGGAFSWQKLYEANKDVIGDDANMIYPHTVLTLPQ